MIVERGRAFRTLHEREGAFVIPNPWDIGTARILAHMGFEALATTSAGYAFSAGKRDNTVGREEMMAHLRAISAATALPVSADLENGYGSTLKAIVETYQMAAEAGVVGASIEDTSGRAGDPILDQAIAAERVRAVAETVHSLSFDFTLTARAENYLHGRKDLNDTIKRLQAYQEAGADVLYAPGLTTREEIAAVVSSVDRPVNVVMGLSSAQLSVAELSALGVKRISVGSAFCRAAMGAFVRGAKEVKERGTFTFAEEAISYADISAMF
jgi:2-methylisocitrate lyase-like PEP mutase family enzyme